MCLDKNRVFGSYTVEKLSASVIMLRRFILTLPITSLYLCPIGDGVILKKICGSVLMLTRLWVMRYVLMLMDTLAPLRSTTEPCLMHQQMCRFVYSVWN